MNKSKIKHKTLKEGHTASSTKENQMSIAQQNQAQYDKVVTPPTDYQDVREHPVTNLPDPQGGAMWGQQQPTPALGAGYLNNQ
jgi:hypothetical protein